MAVGWIIQWNFQKYFCEKTIHLLEISKKANYELSLCLEEREFSSIMARGISGCCHLTLPGPFLVFLFPFRQPPALSLIMASPALTPLALRPSLRLLLSTLRIQSVYTVDVHQTLDIVYNFKYRLPVTSPGSQAD